MANAAGAQRRDTRGATCLFGIETEYGFAAVGADGQRLESAESALALLQEAKRLVPYLPSFGSFDVFTANGSRVYIDHGCHPEVATPECSTPAEAVLFSRAGDRLLARAARAMERTRRSDHIEAVLWKANVDHSTGATWGSHESYLHEAPQSLFAEQLMPHLVSRIVFTGAGGFNNRAKELQFVVSPRAFHLEHGVSSDSTADRGIFHTRDEPLAGHQYRRLHVLAGESLWSETADYLRIGTTALLMASIDAGRRPAEGIQLVSPLAALRTIASDVTCQARVRVRPYRRVSAIGIQRQLLECIESDLGAGYLPSWAEAVCERWRFVLDRLEASPTSLVGVLDWPTKLSVLRRQCEAHGHSWTFSAEIADTGVNIDQATVERGCASDPAFRPKLLEIDMRFNRLDERGIFAALDQQNVLAHRIVAPDAVDRAMRKPPATGRARIRAACVERLAGRGTTISCTWQRIVDEENSQMLVLDDPFQSDGERWQPLPKHPRAVRRTRRLLSAIESTSSI